MPAHEAASNQLTNPTRGARVDEALGRSGGGDGLPAHAHALDADGCVMMKELSQPLSLYSFTN